MSHYDIHSSLGITPSNMGHVHEHLVVVRGASAEFTFDFEKYTYLKPGWGEPWYKYIEQMFFIFKREDEEPIVYKLFTKRKSSQDYDPDAGEEPQTMPNCKYDPDRNCISLLIGSSETAEWGAGTEEDAYSFEISIDTDTYDIDGHLILEQSTDAIIIEPQPPVFVVDSLYREAMYPED